MKYLIIVFLSLTVLYAQDTLNTRPVYKNALGISLNQAITGQMNINNASYSYDPIFASSYYVEYIRQFHKMFWLNAGIGIFNTGYRESYGGDTYNYNDYSLALHLKPQLMLANSKLIVFYLGLSAQANLYLTSFTLSGPDDENLNIFDSKRELKRYDVMPIGNIYGGVISGIGFKIGSRVMIIAEPEFKLNINALAGAQYYHYGFTALYIPYAVGLNLKGFIRF